MKPEKDQTKGIITKPGVSGVGPVSNEIYSYNAEQERAEARKALEAATPGPWKWVDGEKKYRDLGKFVGADGFDVCWFGNNTQYYPTSGDEPDETDIHLITNAPTWLRNSLDREEQLIAENERLKTCQLCGGQGFNVLSNDPYYTQPCECVVFEQVLEDYPKLKVKVAEQDKEIQRLRKKLIDLKQLMPNATYQHNFDQS